MSTFLTNMEATLVASVRSVGTACSLAAVGVYLHRRGFIVGEGKRTLALISQQVTIPLFLFTKLVYCNQDWSTDPCPDITQSLKDTWMLLLWPAYVVSCGLLVGWAVARISQTPKYQRKAVLAACAFGNSTGLPITLLTVVHQNFSSSTELGRIDPTLFLSVYLLLYPCLQWGVGGWLLASDDDTDENTKRQEETNPTTASGYMQSENGDREELLADQSNGTEQGGEGRVGARDTDNSIFALSSALTSSSRRYFERQTSHTHNVLNNKETAKWYKEARRGMAETDASLYISNADLQSMDQQHQESGGGGYHTESDTALPPLAEVGLSIDDPPPNTLRMVPISDASNSDTIATERSGLLLEAPTGTTPTVQPANIRNGGGARMVWTKSGNHLQEYLPSQHFVDTVWKTTQQIAARCLQPPVIGAVLGLIVASIPALRGIFVDLIDRSDDAPLEWLFDALYAVGQAAVPINMMILGCNLSISTFSSTPKTALLSNSTMAAMVIGKLLVMPVIGIVSTIICKNYLWNIPPEIDASFYLVTMIVFLTPTANNVMVMVELSGSGTKEGIARVIAWQYAVAPLLLSFTMAMAVGVASQWSE